MAFEFCGFYLGVRSMVDECGMRYHMITHALVTKRCGANKLFGSSCCDKYLGISRYLPLYLGNLYQSGLLQVFHPSYQIENLECHPLTSYPL